jgi:hypothetical protein
LRPPRIVWRLRLHLTREIRLQFLSCNRHSITRRTCRCAFQDFELLVEFHWWAREQFRCDIRMALMHV